MIYFVVKLHEIIEGVYIMGDFLHLVYCQYQVSAYVYPMPGPGTPGPVPGSSQLFRLSCLLRGWNDQIFHLS